MRSTEEIKRIKEAAEKELLKLPGVTGVAIGQKEKNGKRTGEISILVYVERKKQEHEIPAHQLIPPEIEGVKTDVIETGPMIIHAYKGGTVLQSDHQAGEGTLGGFAFTTETTPRAVLVTNQHVVMSGTNTTPLSGEVGPLVCSICSPCCSKVIGNVLRIVLNANLDGSVALLKPGTEILPEVEDIGVISGTHDITQAESNSGTFAVKIYSRMQGQVVNGTVQSINASGAVNQHNGQLHRNYQNQISISSTTKFSVPGDSGSVLLDNSNRVVGLIFGGNEAGTTSLACPIAQVQSQLQINIATGTAAGQVFTVPASPSNTTSGDPVDMTSVLTGGAAISPRTEKLNKAYKKVLSTGKGREYDRLYHTHMEEVRHLVNTNKRVATVWHRNQGPAFLVHFSNSIMDENYTIPRDVRSIHLAGLLNNMAIILTQYGTAGLKYDIAQYLPELLLYADECNTADKLITGLINYEEKWLTPQEP
jgi:hypothetical protein